MTFAYLDGITIAAHHAFDLDLPLELWIVRRIAGRAVDLYLDTLYSAFELLASGVTTVQHLHARVPKPLDNILHGASEVIRAYRDIGLRVSYSFGLRDQNRLVYEDDASFLRRLPPDLQRLAAELLEEQSLMQRRGTGSGTEVVTLRRERRQLLADTL